MKQDLLLKSSYTRHFDHQSLIRTCEMKPPGFKSSVQLGDGMLVEVLERRHGPCLSLLKGAMLGTNLFFLARLPLCNCCEGNQSGQGVRDFSATPLHWNSNRVSKITRTIGGHRGRIGFLRLADRSVPFYSMNFSSFL